MNKSLLSLVAATSCLLVTHMAFADSSYSPTTKVKNVVQNAGAEGGDSNTRIELVEGTCTLPDGTVSPFILKGDDGKHAQLLSLVLAAYLSGRSLQLGYNAANCNVTYVRLQP